MGARKRKDNQSKINDNVRAHSSMFHDTGSLGGGFPDLVVGYRGVLYLLEVKDGNKPPSKRRLTPDEQKFFNDWAGYPVHVVNSTEEAINAITNE